MFIDLLFYLFLFLMVYTVVLYPVVLKILVKLIKRPTVQKEDIPDFVSIVIPAYNEEKDIADKIQNCLALDYPKNQREIIVVSDCCSDRTDEIVRSLESDDVRLHRMEQRGGKIAGYQSVLNVVKGNIVVFTDATSVLAKDALKNLMANFSDDNVGCVGGRLVYTDANDSSVSHGEQSYWNYETKIKKREEHIASLTSVSGTFYGIRKDLFPVDMPKDLADDFIAVLTCYKKGKRIVFEPTAVCQELAVHESKVELEKRSRITVQNIRGLLHMPEMLNIFKYGWYAFLLISHKLFRLVSPFFLIGVFVCNAMIWKKHILLEAIFFGQLVFYGLALVGCWMKDEKRPKVINLIFYFTLSHIAIFYGFIRVMKGHRMATWETERT